MPALRAVWRGIERAKAAEPLEFEQILIRYAVGLVITVYVAIAFALGELDGHSARVIATLLACAWGLGLAFLVHLSLWPDRQIERRAASIVTDAIELSLLMAYGGKSAAIFFPVYLWVTLGNGFRFGLNYMYAAMALNCGSFLVMAALTPYWRDAWQFSAGLALAIIAIPFYVSKLIRNLRSAMNEAEEASRAKTDFLSMMSHELRTPLNAILGLAQLSRITAPSAKERFSAVSTELAAGRLLRMVDTILKLHRVESGAADRQDRPFDLLDMLNEVRAIIEPLARQKGLDFRIRFKTGLADQIRSDPDHIQTIILNLLTNAVKYTPDGVVTLEIAMRQRAGAGRLRIEVRDTGSGIPAETQELIFERFVRGREHVASAEPGVGLGLSLCKSLTELLGGTLGCESVVGAGSLFWADLPILPADDRVGPAAKAAAPIFWIGAPGSRGVPPTVDAALVEDAASLRDALDDDAELADAVLVADAAALTPDMRKVLREAMTKTDRPPSLVLVETGGEAASDLAPLATAILRRRSQREVAAMVGTVARWHRRIAQHLADEPPSAIPLKRRLKILVADDNALNREVTSRMLELDGHSIVLAETGDEALQHMLDGEVELALLDVNMPGLSGIEACKTYRAGLGSGARIPVVGITADISAQTRKNCLKAGMAEVLAKPVTLDQLRQAVSAHLTAPAVDPGAGMAAERPGLRDGEQRIAFLRELLGEEKFRDQFVPSFRRDVAHSLDLLREGVRNRRAKLIRDALHSLKSSASTAGASQLHNTAAAFEKRGRDVDLPRCQQDIEAALQTYCDQVAHGDRPIQPEKRSA